MLEHLSATNATLLNDQDFQAKSVLCDGDTITIAERVFVYRKGMYAYYSVKKKNIFEICF